MTAEHGKCIDALSKEEQDYYYKNSICDYTDFLLVIFVHIIGLIIGSICYGNLADISQLTVSMVMFYQYLFFLKY